ncbi:MAG: ABC transporter ATP-binding protein [Anaerolineaceae bacterium]|nr:ABC transporter ATP-binding protein [Anaerolineaceae bacterium]
MTDNVIETENLRRDFGEIHALDGISFEVPSGIIFGFLGPNGSGKTTTIRLLLGLLEPSAGSAKVLGYDTIFQSDGIRQESGALLEYTGLYERMTAEDNLEFYGRVWRIPAEERRARIHELLDSIGLWERRREVVRDWSRGMRQKLAVARALLHHPKLIFMDEPIAGLDPVAAAALREDLETLVKQRGTTVFLTTHNLAEAERLCNKLAVIHEGKLLAIGSPDELGRKQGGMRLVVIGSGFGEGALASLRAHPEVSDVRLAEGRILIDHKTDIGTSPLVRILVNAGVEIEEVRKERASLEEVFLTLVEEENV